MSEIITPIHTNPVDVINSAKERESGNSSQIIIVRDIQNSEVGTTTADAVFNLTGRSIDQFSDMIKKDLEEFRKTLSTHSSQKIKEESLFAGSGGDLLTLDPELINEKELKTGKKGNVEFLMVKELEIDGKNGELALVKMFRYGVLKKLVLPEGNPSNQIEWEAIICLENKSLPDSHLTVIYPENIKDNNGLLVAQDNGVKTNLYPGDILFAPLGIARQVISNSGDFNGAGAKYLTYGPSWDGEGSIQQVPVYWPSQVNSK